MGTNVRDANLTSLFRIYGKNFAIDTGKKVNKALSFLTAFLASVLLNQVAKSIGMEAVSGGYQRYSRRNM